MVNDDDDDDDDDDDGDIDEDDGMTMAKKLPFLYVVCLCCFFGFLVRFVRYRLPLERCGGVDGAAASK